MTTTDQLTPSSQRPSPERRVSSALYHVQSAELRAGPVSPRRGQFKVLPGLRDLEESNRLVDEMMQAFNPEMVGCSTQEMARRPIPHVFEPSPQMEKLRELFEFRAADTYRFLFSRIAPMTQTYDRRSRLGYPEFNIPADKWGVLSPYFEKFLRGDLSVLDSAFVILNVRLQPERIAKERLYMFLDDGGVPYETVVSGNDRLVDGRFASRTRIVFNYPVTNLLCQVVDSALHNVFMLTSFAHHDMTRFAHRPLSRPMLALDVKNFDRTVGALVHLHAKAVGGLYQEIYTRMLNLPFLVPSDNRRNGFKVRGREGTITQMGSGVSCVADLAKIVFLILYSELNAKIRGLTFRTSLREVYECRAAFGVMNYGDDNVIIEGDVEPGAVAEWLSQYLPVEEEKPAKFLGFHYAPEEGFFLALPSYINNFYLAERSPGSRFRPYPHLGWVQRREDYRKLGDRKIAAEVYDKEASILKQYIPTYEIYELAEQERRLAGNQPIEVTLGKDYLLTEAQRARLPEYQTLGPAITTPIIKRLVNAAHFQSTTT